MPGTFGQALEHPESTRLQHRGLLGAHVGVEVAGGGLEIGVAQEFLDGADVHSLADQLGGKGVAHPGRAMLAAGKPRPERGGPLVAYEFRTWPVLACTCSSFIEASSG